MLVKRSVIAAVGASLVLLLGVPSVAVASTAAPASLTAGPTLAGDPIDLGDPALVASPQIELTGEIVVVTSEPPVFTPGDVIAAPPTDLTSYYVTTDGGDSVPITGEVPDGVKTGDGFTGTVAVPQSVIDQLAPAEAAEVLASTQAAPVQDESVASEAVREIAQARSLSLPVAEASVESTTAEAKAAAAHELQVVVVNPAGVAPSAYTDASLKSVATKASNYWVTQSHGQLSRFPVVAAVKRISSSAGCAQDPFERWDEAARGLGYANTDDYINSAPAGVYRHLMVVLPAGCEAGAGVGIGSVGATVHWGGATQVVFGVNVDLQVSVHELGHNLSLGHSNVDYCASNAATAGCTEYEYYDFYDVMGVSVDGQDAHITTLNSRHQLALGFSTVAAANTYTLPAGVATSSWNVTLGRINGTAVPTILEIVDPATGGKYWVEYRGGESGAFYTSGQRIDADGGTVALGAGVRLLRATDTSGSSAISQLDSMLGGNTVRPYASTAKTIGNPSGSVQVAVKSMSESAGAVLTITVKGKAVSAAPQPVYRFWSPSNHTHFFTMSVTERDSIIAKYPKSTWTYEGISFQAFKAQVPGSVPLYRFWSARLGGHFYTVSESEKNKVIDSYDDYTWQFEGTAFYVYPTSSTVANTVTVARFWSPTNQHHFYTASAAERDKVRANYPASIWTYEGTAFRVPKG